VIDDPGTDLVVADVSVLEMALSWRTGKIALPEPPRVWVERQGAIWSLRFLPMSRDHIYRTTELPE
jgi:PIN domain nuclease of toxin-antitoxin system